VQAADQLQAIHLGHEQIRHDYVGAIPPILLKRLSAVPRLEHFVAVALQHPSDNLADDVFVIHH
jgi:hypothetical protein